MKQILIIQTAFIGDVILATGVAETLHEAFPEAEIDMLVRKGNESLFRGHPFLREVLVRDKRAGKARSLWRMLRTVRARRYDLVVNLHRFLSSGVIAGFSRAGHVCGFDKNPLSRRYDHKVPHRIGDRADPVHETQRNHSVIAHLVKGKPEPPRLYPSPRDYEAAKHDKPYVCIAPTSVWFTKQWPEARWAGLIGRLDRDLTVFLLGGPGDRLACSRIARDARHPDVRVYAGDLSLLESAALMRGAVMNYVNDSAPTHLASAMDAPVTTIYCSTVPAFGFYPISPMSRVAETHHDLQCRPCGLHGYKACPKGHFMCSEISVENVLG